MTAPPTATPDIEENWFSLIQAIKAGTVIPVIGPDLLEIEVSNASGEVGSKTLDLLIAEELSRRYGLPLAGKRQKAWVLHEYVAALISSRPLNSDKIRRSVASALASVTGACAIPLPLQQLAAIENFAVFVSLNCDDLLLRALQGVDARAESFAYGIRSDSNGSPVDIPPKAAGTISYQLLGSARNPLDFAIHEGDVLEYLFRLQSEQARRVPNILGALRASHLLLIGCRLPDGAGRSLLRLVNNESLQSKSTVEFMAEHEGDPALTTFIARFSPNSLVFPGRAGDFVAELDRRRQATPRPGKAASRGAFTLKAAAATTGPLVFVSYASENSLAARAIAERLLTLGAGNVWLDKKKLRGGDDWSTRIDEAIAECDYFLPLLSSEADRRREGVFWEEWDSALSRGAPGGGRLPAAHPHRSRSRQSYRLSTHRQGTGHRALLQATSAQRPGRRVRRQRRGRPRQPLHGFPGNLSNGRAENRQGEPLALARPVHRKRRRILQRP